MSVTAIDDAARREYWRSQLELAYDFMQQATNYPVDECGERMVSLTEASACRRLLVREEEL